MPIQFHSQFLNLIEAGAISAALVSVTAYSCYGAHCVKQWFLTRRKLRMEGRA